MSQNSTVIAGGVVAPVFLNDDGTKRVTVLGNNVVQQLAGTPSGTLIITETPDVVTFVGYAGAPGVQVSIGINETPDIVSFVGNVVSIGTMAFTERQDVFSAYLALPIVGTIAITEAQDIFAAVGFGRGVDGHMDITEALDTVSIHGTTPVVGTMAATEVPDHVQILGVGVSRVRPRRPFFIT